jgi:hypothetical protein
VRVLRQVAEGPPQAGGDEVASVAEEDCCFCGRVFGIAPGSLDGC